MCVCVCSHCVCVCDIAKILVALEASRPLKKKKVEEFACEYKGCDKVFKRKATLAAHVRPFHFLVSVIPRMP